jgi:hypothetical protein
MPRQRRWEPNTRLVYERERRGWVQEDAAREAEKVAGRLGRPDLVFTGAQFGRWERGESRPRSPLRRVVCVLYDASAEALGLLEGEVGTANRRTAIKAITVMGGLGALGTRRLLSDAADAAVAASRKRAILDPMTLEELDQDVERFALDCSGVAHAELFPQVWDDWQHVERLFDTRHSLKDRAHLTLLGGQLTYFLARLSFNMGDYAARGGMRSWPGSMPRMWGSRCCAPRCGRCRARLPSTPDNRNGPWNCWRPLHRTTARTAARGSRRMPPGRTRCWVTDRGQNKP